MYRRCFITLSIARSREGALPYEKRINRRKTSVNLRLKQRSEVFVKTDADCFIHVGFTERRDLRDTNDRTIEQECEHYCVTVQVSVRAVGTLLHKYSIFGYLKIKINFVDILEQKILYSIRVMAV